MCPKGNTIDDATVIGEKYGGLYNLKGQLEQALVHDTIEPSDLWHRRIAHVHYRPLPMERKVVSGLPKIQEKHEVIFKGCPQGKNVKKTFPSSESKAKEILEIVQSDVCRPMSSSSLSKYVYYVSFIDDFSHKTWIYLLKGKNKVFNKFKEYKPLVKNQTYREIKTLRSDNGGEFTS